MALFAAFSPASASAATGVTTNWYATTIVRMSLTPNYVSPGYGPVQAAFGPQPTPNPASGSCYDGCAIDFGNILSGTNYLYKYAVHLNVTSNDPNGVSVYGEGAADFTTTSGSDTQPVNQTVYYLPCNTCPASDANTGYSSALPFARTGGTVSGNTFGTMPTVTYGTYPSPIGSITGASGDLYYDYQLHVPASATGGQYYVWIVYTVVGR